MDRKNRPLQKMLSRPRLPLSAAQCVFVVPLRETDPAVQPLSLITNETVSNQLNRELTNRQFGGTMHVHVSLMVGSLAEVGYFPKVADLPIKKPLYIYIHTYIHTYIYIYITSNNTTTTTNKKQKKGKLSLIKRGSCGSFWLYLRCRGTVDNKVCVCGHWASGEPNNSGDEDCEELEDNGYWNDEDCTWHTHTHARTHARTHAHTHTRTDTHKHTHTHTPVS